MQAPGSNSETTAGPGFSAATERRGLAVSPVGWSLESRAAHWVRCVCFKIGRRELEREMPVGRWLSASMALVDAIGVLGPT